MRAQSIATQAIDEPSGDLPTRIRQLRIITAAYQSLTVAEPILPSAGSPLPALLALRHTEHLIDETKISIHDTQDHIKRAREQINREIGDLREARLLAEALESRISKLQEEHASDLEMTSTELAQSIVAHHKIRNRRYTLELKKLLKALKIFIGDYLAVMLAAEDLGGPVVGDLYPIDEEILINGFDMHGQPKKPRVANTNNVVKRKQRIAELWGSSDYDKDGTIYETEKGAAGAAFRSLTEELLNASFDETESDPYILISKETAAVRFLIRAQIARLHPQDAKRLRLVDFAQEENE